MSPHVGNLIDEYAPLVQGPPINIQCGQRTDIGDLCRSSKNLSIYSSNPPRPVAVPPTGKIYESDHVYQRNAALTYHKVGHRTRGGNTHIFLTLTAPARGVCKKRSSGFRPLASKINNKVQTTPSHRHSHLIVQVHREIQGGFLLPAPKNLTPHAYVGQCVPAGPSSAPLKGSNFPLRPSTLATIRPWAPPPHDAEWDSAPDCVPGSLWEHRCPSQ